MIKAVRFQNFTSVPNAEWKFASGLNVILGENSLGKSHVLKAIYAMLKVQRDKQSDLTKSTLEKSYADKLIGVMRPESPGRLVKRKQGRDRCEIALTMNDDKLNSAIGFASNTKTLVDVIQVPLHSLEKSPVYLPTRELVTLCPWFLSLVDNYHLEFEETWRDTVSLLGAPSVKGPREKKTSRLLEPLEAAMGGKVLVDAATGRFYLQISGGGKMEMPLVAEGLRKIAMLARLISTGTLLEQGYFFWDEPESNLNPKLIKVVAECIMNLCKQGIQVFIASHSLFLLRELEMLSANSDFKQVKQRYFALAASENGTELEQGDNADSLKTLVLLDEELKQSDRFIGMEP